MIANEYQYRRTQAAAKKFRRALDKPVAPARPGVHPRLLKAEHEALASQLGDLERELTDYERLKKDRNSRIEIGSVAGIGQGLIRARIAAGLSQKQLADRLGVKPQQIQRYETAQYATASLRRLDEVARGLGVRIDRPIVFAASRASPR